MALAPNLSYVISKYSPYQLVVTDKTGAYNVTTNPGGWGAPNVELDESAVWLAVIRKPLTGNSTVNGYVKFVYDPTAVNTKETTFTVPFPQDSVYDIVLGQLPVSLNGTTYVQGGTIANNAYFYWAAKAWKMTSGVPVEVTDIASLVGVSGIPQKTCGDALYPQLAIVKQGLYKDYTLARINNDNSDILFNEVLKLREDLEGVSNTYWSGLTAQAQSQIESLINRYQVQPYV